MARATSADVLIINNAEDQLEPVLQVLAEFPELNTFPASPINKTTFKTFAITADPAAAFRTANSGRTVVKPTFTNKTVTCKFLDGSWDVDQLVAQESDRPLEDTLRIMRQSSLRGAFGELCSQIWYGTDNDANGFAGMASLYPNTDSDNVVDAEGTGAACHDAWLVHFDPDTAFALVWGDEAEMNIGEVELGTLPTDDGSTLWGYKQNIAGWCGLQLFDWESAVRICNITTAKPMTDDLFYDALAKMRSRKAPNACFVNRTVANLWRKSRTATNALGSPAPPVREVEDVPIYLTDSLVAGTDLSPTGT